MASAAGTRSLPSRLRGLRLPGPSRLPRLRRYPVRRQLEASDCGPACLEMISTFHGARHALALLRELANVQPTGTSLLDLSRAAQELGYRTHGVQVEDPAELEDEEGRALLPAIAHWEGNHFVVLYEVTPRAAVVGDPAVGLRRIPRERLSEHWEGVLLLLEPTGAIFHPPDVVSPADHRPTALGRFARGLLRYRALLAQIFVATLLLQGVALAQPLLIQRLIDRAVGQRAPSLLVSIGAALAALVLAQLALTVARGAALFTLSSSYSMLLLTQFWKRLLALPVSFFARRHRGDLLKRIEDHQRIRRVLQGAAASVLLDLLMLVGYGALLLSYGKVIFLVFAAGTALYAAWTAFLLPRRTQLDQDRFQVGTTVSRLELQLIGGIQTLKACGAERQARASWERLQLRDLAAGRRLWRLDTLHQAGALVLSQAMLVGLLIYEAQLVLAGRLTVGQMAATLAVVGLVLAPMQNLVNFAHELQDVLISLRRVEIVYEVEPELKDEAEPGVAFERAPALRAEGITFRYGSPSEAPVLEDVSLTIPAGRMTAIVGRSGAGKTTLAQVLYGFYRPQEGRVLYDGQPVESWPPERLRRSSAFVFQRTDIFDGTLAENIALGDERPDPERLLQAARVASLDDLLALPQGLSTRIGESGVRLSGGEEQRLQIARAIYRNPRVLFLDEATSHLDAATERAITEALQREASGRTLVVVAHRLSTIRRADHIIVLERGRVVEQGTHEALLAIEGGHYRALVENQLESS